MTHPDCILKSRDITLPTKAHLVKVELNWMFHSLLQINIVLFHVKCRNLRSQLVHLPSLPHSLYIVATYITYIRYQFSLVQSLSHVRLSMTPWTAARQTSLSITNSQSLLKLMSIESVMPSISSSAVPFSSHLQSFPALGSFQMNQLFTSGGQSIGVSASTSVLPMNFQDWFPLG